MSNFQRTIFTIFEKLLLSKQNRTVQKLEKVDVKLPDVAAAGGVLRGFTVPVALAGQPLDVHLDLELLLQGLSPGLKQVRTDPTCVLK